MLRALKEQLMQLSTVDKDSFAEKIQAHISEHEAPAAINSLRNLILIMPDLIHQIRVWANDSRVPAKDKELHGFILTYLYQPVDFLPESEHGFFGYLDDAYFVGAVYISTMLHMDYGTRQFLQNLSGLENKVPEWLETARKVMPDEAEKIDVLVKQLLEGKK